MLYDIRKDLAGADFQSISGDRRGGVRRILHVRRCAAPPSGPPHSAASFRFGAITMGNHMPSSAGKTTLHLLSAGLAWLAGMDCANAETMTVTNLYSVP